MKSIWRGSISFGLVNIPVRLYGASRQREIKFHLLHKKDLSKIRYARICSEEEKEIPWEDIVKGYEVEPGHFVVFTDEDFNKANIRKAKTLDILQCVDEREIDPMFIQTPYFIEPEKGSAKPYGLLCEALKKANKVAMGSVVFRNHEHLGFIKPQGNLLLFIQIRFFHDIVSSKDLDIPSIDTNKKEIDMAIKFINNMTSKFRPKDFSDTYTEEIKAIIKEKGKGHKIVSKEKAAPKPKVHDILSLLKTSLEQSKKPKKWKKSA